MAWPILNLAIAVEADIVTARQCVRQVAELLGFDRQDQTRIATAVSEIARNAFAYAGSGRIEVTLQESNHPQMLLIRVIDRGKGIADVDARDLA